MQQEKIINELIRLYENLAVLFYNYSAEVILGALVISIAVVFFSILFVIFHNPQKIKPVRNPSKAKKIKKIKYSKNFLKRVKGIDLDLK